jgi:hypothetical protein
LSNTLIIEQHPCLVIEDIAARHGLDLIFTYSRYEVAPPGLQAASPRTAMLRVSGSDITANWIMHRLAELGPNEEMAWHSWVECKGVSFHIPMIDFVGRPAHSVFCQVSRVLAAEMDIHADFVLFDTERSFHGYFLDLLPEQAWSKYLGQLLLLNEDNRPPVIDARWVGHALTRGFSALRWSNNTNRYPAMPRLVSHHSVNSSR